MKALRFNVAWFVSLAMLVSLKEGSLATLVTKPCLLGVSLQGSPSVWYHLLDLASRSAGDCVLARVPACIPPTVGIL